MKPLERRRSTVLWRSMSRLPVAARRSAIGHPPRGSRLPRHGRSLRRWDRRSRRHGPRLRPSLRPSQRSRERRARRRAPPGPPAPGRTPHPRRDRRNLPSGARPTSGPMGSLRRPSRFGRRMRLVPTGVGARARTCPAIRITGSGKPLHPRRRSRCRLRGRGGDAKKGMPPKVPPCSVWLWYTNIMP